MVASRIPGVGYGRREGFRGIGGRRGGAPPFDPAVGAALALRGDDVVLDSGRVATWTDRSGNGRHYTQSTAGQRPTIDTLGGQPALVFVVLAADADPPAANARTGLWQFSTVTLGTHYPYTDGVVYDQFGTSVRKTTGNPTPSLAALRLYEVITTPDEWTNRIDGVQHYTTPTNAVEWRASATSIGGSIDASGSAGVLHLDGKIAEVLVYPSKRDASHLAQLYTYFAGRYSGLVLP